MRTPAFAPSALRPAFALPLLLTALLAAAPARADDRSELEQLRATTTALIQALVDQGLISRERAEGLLRQTAPPRAALAAAAPAAAASGAPPVVRVPYIPESVRAQITEEVKLGVLSTARDEGWADARKLPAWLSAVTFAGDIRLRAQNDRFAPGNLAADVYRSQVDSPAWSPDLTNTTHNRERLTLRARFGATVKVSDTVSTGIRFSTGGTGTLSGGTGGPATASQTLGNDFNRYAIGLDRAWLRWEPVQDWRIEGGRIAVPFYGTDLLWSDDLAVDGVAVHGEHNLARGAYGFVNIGAFPLEESALTTSRKWLLGAQIGGDWSIDAKTQWRLGLAIYDFSNIEGTHEANPAPTGALAGTVAYQLSQYPPNFRQRGNTLINLNDPTNTGAPVWGLASKFRPINLTTGITFRQFAPTEASLVVDYVKNSAFDLADIRRRAGTDSVDTLANKTTGLQARLMLGAAAVAEKGTWQTFVAFRKFDRDAWVDGLTDTTWHLGGTSYKGYSLGATYAFERNTTLGLRWTSTRNLDDGVRTVVGGALTGNLSSAPLKIDVIQLEVNSRF